MTDTADVNADFGARVVMKTADMEWQPSPSPTVWRKRVMRVGPAEAGRVTSVVRYDADSSFARHEHPDGEEILVLDGVFSDDRGDHPAGTFMLNPEGFSHAPFSKDGCVLFVKLRQFAGLDRPTVRVDTRDPKAAWTPRAEGIESLTLYQSDAYSEHIRLTRFAAGAAVGEQYFPTGEDIFVIDGALEDESGTYPKGTWLRLPVGSRHIPRSPMGCLLYVCSGAWWAHT